MPGHRKSNGPRGKWGPAAACSAVSVGSFGVIAASAGPVRLIAGLSLVGAFACGVWLAHRARFRAIVPAIGLTLVFLVLAGLALAAVHARGAVPIALAMGVTTLAIAWASTAPGLAGREAGKSGRKAPLGRRGMLAIAGGVIFAGAAVLSVRYAAASATAGDDSASSLAVWAYPAGGLLHVGAQEPAGHGAVSVRIVVTRAGVAVASWNNVRLAPGQTWQVTTPSVDGNRPVQVTALRGGIIVASLSA